MGARRQATPHCGERHGPAAVLAVTPRLARAFDELSMIT
jgi:hypothetical protein